MTKQARLNALINRINGRISALMKTPNYDYDRFDTLVALYFKARNLERRLR